jgi:phosphoribosylanthranilate isomerase
MRIKVCGMTAIEQLHELGELGVQFAGMIFYPKSPRYVLKHGLKAADVRKEKLKVFKVGVFVNAPYEEVMQTVYEYGLDMVQLHGDETPYQCDKLSSNIQVIKAFRFGDNDDVQWRIRDFYETDMFLFDTGVKSSSVDPAIKDIYGGTGRKFNWERLKGLNIAKPFFLSGGIEPTDAGSIQRFMQDPVAKDLFAVDINSRFEVMPGIKNMSLITQFIKELNDAVSDTTKAE